jgi:GNAT superfamily N-acetyltransferase
MIDSERVAGMDSHCSTFSIAAGNGAVNPVFTATYAGFVNGETAAVLGGTLVFARAQGEGVGSYLITPSGLANGNYAIAFNRDAHHHRSGPADATAHAYRHNQLMIT